MDDDLGLGLSLFFFSRAISAGFLRVVLAENRQLILQSVDHCVGVACDADKVQVDEEIVLQRRFP